MSGTHDKGGGMLSDNAGALSDSASSPFPGGSVPWWWAVCRRDKPRTKVSSLGTEDLGSEGTVDHGIAPA
eukprot:7160861-Lingulodinium_polyedra.AAC.1